MPGAYKAPALMGPDGGRLKGRLDAACYSDVVRLREEPLRDDAPEREGLEDEDDEPATGVAQ